MKTYKEFKQYISEIFDNPYKYHIYTFYRPNTYAYFLTKGTFEPEDKLFSVKIFGRQTKDGYVSEFGFSNYINWKNDMTKMLNTKPPFSEKDIIQYINFYKGTDKKQDVNTPDTIRIFTTVIHIIRDYYEEFKPDVLLFKAKMSEENRVKLYTRIAEKFAKEYEDELTLEIKPFKNYTTFRLIRK